MRMGRILVIQTFGTYRTYHEISLITKGHFGLLIIPICGKCPNSLDSPNLPYYIRIYEDSICPFCRECPEMSARFAASLPLNGEMSGFVIF